MFPYGLVDNIFIVCGTQMCNSLLRGRSAVRRDLCVPVLPSWLAVIIGSTVAVRCSGQVDCTLTVVRLDKIEYHFKMKMATRRGFLA